MAITFKHQAGAGLIGAYAAGQANSRRRGQKYAMARLMQDQQHRNRMQEMFGREQMRGGRRAGVGRQAAPEGVWRQPGAGRQIENRPIQGQLGGGLGMGRQDDGNLLDNKLRDMPQEGTPKWHAMKRGNERARKHGRPLPNPEIEPVFVPQAQLDLEAEIAGEGRAEARGRRDKLFADDIGDGNRQGIEQFQQGEADLRHRREVNKGAVHEAPEWFSPEAKKRFAELNKAELELRNKRKFNQEDRRTTDKLDEIEQEREDLRIAHPEPDRVEEWNKGIMYQHEDGTVSRTRGSGFDTPVRRDADGEFIEIPPSGRVQDEAKQAEEAAVEQQKVKAAEDKQYDDIYETIRKENIAAVKADEGGDTTPLAPVDLEKKTRKEIDRIRLRDEARDRGNAPILPPPPEQVPPQPVSIDPVTGAVNTGGDEAGGSEPALLLTPERLEQLNADAREGGDATQEFVRNFYRETGIVPWWGEGKTQEEMDNTGVDWGRAVGHISAIQSMGAYKGKPVEEMSRKELEDFLIDQLPKAAKIEDFHEQGEDAGFDKEEMAEFKQSAEDATTERLREVASRHIAMRNSGQPASPAEASGEEAEQPNLVAGDINPETGKPVTYGELAKAREARIKNAPLTDESGAVTREASLRAVPAESLNGKKPADGTEVRKTVTTKSGEVVTLMLVWRKDKDMYEVIGPVHPEAKETLDQRAAPPATTKPDQYGGQGSPDPSRLFSM